LFDVLGVDKDFVVDGLELVGAWSEHFHDDVWSLPRWRELCDGFVALDEAKYQVPDIEGPTHTRRLWYGCNACWYLAE